MKNIQINFESKEVFLVMRTKRNPSKVKIYLDDKMQYFGEDVVNGIVTFGTESEAQIKQQILIQ